MSKKKSTSAKTTTSTAAKTVANTTEEVKTEEAVVETPVESTENKEETNETVTEVEPVSEEKTEESFTTTVEEVPETKEEPVIEPVIPEETKENENEVKELSDEEQLTPVTENKTVLGSAKKEIKGSSDDVQKELATKYKVKFAQSYFMKICAAVRTISLFSIIETWMINKNAFIGLMSKDDFNHIKEVVEGNIITYKYKVLSAEAKKSFLEKLEFNTNYVVSHK